MHTDYKENPVKTAVLGQLDLPVSLANQVLLDLKASPAHKDVRAKLGRLDRSDLLVPLDLKENQVLRAKLVVRDQSVLLGRLDLKEKRARLDTLDQLDPKDQLGLQEK